MIYELKHIDFRSNSLFESSKTLTCFYVFIYKLKFLKIIRIESEAT